MSHHRRLTTTQTPPYHHPYNHHYQPPPPPPPQPHCSNYENTLLAEVRYLHSLWHRGPPQHASKKPRHVSDKDWPVPYTPHVTPPSTWPAFPAHNKPTSRPATGPEKARAVGLRIQLRAVESCSSLFRPRPRPRDNPVEGSDDDEEEEEEDDGDDEEEVDLFERLFEDDDELRGFYKRNCDGNCDGVEFVCLVCGVVGGNKSVGRKYKNCVALVQHSVTVSRTKKRKAHRAFGNVVCKVLGWDVNRLPSVPVPQPGDVRDGEVKNHDDQDPAVVNMELDAALEKDNVTNTDTGLTEVEPTHGLGEVKNHAGEDSAVAEVEREIIPVALEKDTRADAGCIEIGPTHEGEAKLSHNEADITVVRMEGEVTTASQSHSDPEGIPNAFEKDNGASTDVRCIASALTHEEGDVKSQNEANNTDVVKEGEVATLSQSHSEPEGIPNAFEKDNGVSTDVRCIASALTCEEVNFESGKKTVGRRTIYPRWLIVWVEWLIGSCISLDSWYDTPWVSNPVTDSKNRTCDSSSGLGYPVILLSPKV